MFLAVYSTEGCQVVGKCLSVEEELCHLDDVRMRMCFIQYQKGFSHNLAFLRPLWLWGSLATLKRRSDEDFQSPDCIYMACW